MAAVSRFVLFDSDAETSISTDTNESVSGTGTPGYVESASAAPDTVTITTGVADTFGVSIDGGAVRTITLPSGTNIDSRTLARVMEYEIKKTALAPEVEHITVNYVNNKFRITSSSLGTTSQVAVSHVGNSCLHLIGMALSQGGPLDVSTPAGSATTNNASFTGNFTAGGEYKGQFADIYTVMIGTEHPVQDPVPSGGNVYPVTPSGNVQSAGDWNEGSNETYTLTISTTNGNVMNAGTGNVPTFSSTSTLGDNTSSTELLYSDYWYEVGSKGLLVKFADFPFGNGDVFTVTCSAIAYASGTSTAADVGDAEYVWSARAEGKSATSTTTSDSLATAIGTRGVTGAWDDSGQLTRRDEFRVICSGPQPNTVGVTTLNYGSVTVSTYSEPKAVWFELESGAVVLSNTKFGLQSNGTANFHNPGGGPSFDTFFAFGTGGNATPGADGTEWKKDIDPASDLSSDTPPAYLAATEDNLSVVSTAAASETVGVAAGEMVTDFIHLAVKLGASETGANPSIVYRCFFDFS